MKTIKQTIRVHLSELVNGNNTDFCNLVSMEITGSETKLIEFNYKLVGCDTDNNMVILEVNGEIHELEYNIENNTITYQDEEVIDCADLSTNDIDVINKVIEIYNNANNKDTLFGSIGTLDEYLLNESKIDQEDREIIIESLYNHLY